MSGLFGLAGMAGSFGGGGVNQMSPAFASLNIQTSSYGAPVPLCYGTSLIAGNLLWYGDFRAVGQQQSAGGKGGGGQTGTTYTYYVAAAIGLAEGPLTTLTENVNGVVTTYAGVRKVLVNQQVLNLADINLGSSTGAAAAPVWPYLASAHPDQAISYPLLGYVYSSSYNLGSSANMPQQNFEVVGLLANSTTGIYDAHPFGIALDLVTSTTHGAVPGATWMVDQSNSYTYSAGIWLSPAYRTQTPAAEILKKLALLANCEWVWSSGQLRWLSYGLDSIVGGPGVTQIPGSIALAPQAYAPGSQGQVQYAFTDQDFVDMGGTDPVMIIRRDPADCFNVVQVTYRNRYTQYADAIAEAKDLAQIEAYGVRPMPPIEAREICDPAVAMTVANLVLQRQLYIRNTYRFRVAYSYILLDPMDLVSLTESTLSGLQGQVVRVTSITENEDGTLDIEAEDVVGNVTSAPVFTQQLPSGYTTNYNAAPGSVAAPVLFDAPGRLATAGYEIWAAVSGPVNGVWGGAYVWVSLDGNTYKQAGQIVGAARMGVTTTAMVAGTDPDTTGAVGLDLTASGAVLTSGTSADADAGNTLSWIEGELVSYSVATLTAASKYTIGTYMRRGVYGTVNGPHAAGSRFVRLDSRVFRYAYDASLIGKQVYFKFTSFNIWQSGVESLATVPAYTYTINGPIGAPGDVTGLQPSVVSGGVNLVWTPVTTPRVDRYEIRLGTSWATATYVGTSGGSTFLLPYASGTATYLVKAVDTSGRYSVNAASTVLSVQPPSAPIVTQQVIDNTVLLYWTLSTGTQPIKTYEVRRGPVFATATVVGQKSGGFTTVFETLGGTYTYWVVPIDSAGTYGAPGSTTATVSSPPDYVLKANVQSTFNGTLTNALVDPGAGGVVMPVDTATTFGAHFTNSAWASPQDQINAGFPIYIQKGLTSGAYQENIDYGTTLTATKITATYLGVVVAGAPVVSCSIQTSPDNVTWTTYTNAASVYATNFRYVRVVISVAAAATGLDIYTLQSLNVRLDAKLKNDAGSVSANAADTNGTPFTFNTPFLSVTSITATPVAATAGAAASLTAVVIFAGALNPTGAAVMLFNSAGARVSGSVAWNVKGY